MRYRSNYFNNGSVRATFFSLSLSGTKQFASFFIIFLRFQLEVVHGGGPKQDRASSLGEFTFFFFFFSLLRFFLPAKRIFIPSDARGKQSSFVILPLPLGKRLPANTVNLTSQTRAPRIRRRSR